MIEGYYTDAALVPEVYPCATDTWLTTISLHPQQFAAARG